MPLPLADILKMSPYERQLYFLSVDESVYFAHDEALQLVVQSSVAGHTISVNGTYFSLQRGYTTFQMDVSPAGDQTPSTTSLAMAEGFLVSAVVSITGGTTTAGTVFARLFKARGVGSVLQRLQLILAGFVEPRPTLSFPGLIDGAQAPRRTRVRSITGTDPAAGAEIVETVPASVHWRIITLRATLVTDATAANRIISLTFTDGSDVPFVSAPLVTQVASQTGAATWGIGLPEDGSIITRQTQPLPSVFLPAGFTVETSTSGLQAADNWSPPFFIVEEQIDV